MNELSDAVIQLHNIAMLIETQIGKGLLAEDVRKAADRLSILLKPTMVKESK